MATVTIGNVNARSKGAVAHALERLSQSLH
jgi:hypothetical protein